MSGADTFLPVKPVSIQAHLLGVDLLAVKQHFHQASLNQLPDPLVGQLQITRERGIGTAALQVGLMIEISLHPLNCQLGRDREDPVGLCRLSSGALAVARCPTRLFSRASADAIATRA